MFGGRIEIPLEEFNAMKSKIDDFEKVLNNVSKVRTGFYLLLAGDYESKDIVPLMIEMYEFIRDFKDEVPGASAKDCGNYLDMNLGMANYLAKRYLDNVLYHIDETRLVYPE